VWRQQTTAFQDVSAYTRKNVNLTDDGDPEQVAAGQVSAGFFRLFGAPVVYGRTFTEAEDQPNGGHVGLLSGGVWRRLFGGDPNVVGRTLPVDGDSYLIIGVLGRFDMQAMQTPVSGPPEIWLPFQIDPNSTMQGNFFQVAGRLRPGVTSEV